MEMVSASKMRRAQLATLASRPFAEKSWQVLTYLAAQPGSGKLLHPLLEERAQVKAITLLLITSDRGLCGAYNVNVIRKALDFMRQTDKPVKLVTIGRRGRDIANRMHKPIVAEFTGLSEKPTILDVGPINNVAVDEFTHGNSDQVYVAYTKFKNVLNQIPTVQQILPIRPAQEAPDGGGGAGAVYLYEPSPEVILDTVLPRFTEMQIYQMILESVASEHSARMVAMRNATENAHELIQDLTLAMNKARQALITKEMLDIAGGVEAQRQAES
jgi:F-type H+-transporting ATPase subunit gamma